MKKLIAVLSCLLILLSLCGCRQENAKADITVVLMDKGRCSAEEGDMTSNRWTRYINEHSGVTVEFIAVARDNFEENLNLLLASGTVPDIMLTYEATYVQQLIDQELIQPIGNLIDQYSTACKDYLKANPTLESYLTFEGELYAMSNTRGTTLDQGMWIRQDWLDAVSMDAPTTEAEFLAVCRAFKQANLGGEDTVPIATMTYLWDYFAPMYAAHDMWYVDENGNMEYGVLTDRFAAATTLMKTCYDEGLISKEFATDTDSTIATRNWVTGKSGILLYKASPVLMQELLENDPNANPVPLAPFSTAWGPNALHQSSLVNSYILISSQCENTRAAIQYLDWLLSEGWFVLENGLEGTHYNLDEQGFPVAVETDEVNAQMRYASAYVLLSQNKVTPESVMATAAKDSMSQRIASLEVQSMDVNGDLVYRRDISREPDVSDYGILYADWSLIEKRLMIRAITGEDKYSVNDMMRELQNEWNTHGGESVTKQVQDWYNSTYSK